MSDVQDRIRQFVAINDLSSAISLLDGNISTLLSSRLSAVEKQYSLGAIQFPEYSTIKNQIGFSILSACGLSSSATADTIPVRGTSTMVPRLTSATQIEDTYALLLRKFANFELNPPEVITFCDQLYTLTHEDVFLTIKTKLEVAVKNKTSERNALEFALHDLEEVQGDVMTFVRSLNNEKRENKSLITRLHNFKTSPSDATWNTFKDKAIETFASKAFYTDDQRKALESLFHECPPFSGFGWKSLIAGYVDRIHTWLLDNHKD